MNVGGTQVGVRWAYTTPVEGVTSTDDAVLAVVDEFNNASGDQFSLYETIGFDELKTVNKQPNLFTPGNQIALCAQATGAPLVFVAGPVGWPEIVPDVDPPGDPTYGPWVEQTNTLPTPTGGVSGFIVTSDDDNLHVQWNRFGDAIEYQLRFRRATSDTWLALADLPQTESDVQEWAYPWTDDARFVAGQGYVYQLRPRLT